MNDDNRDRTSMENRLKYELYVRNAPDGIFIVDDTGRYIEVNSAACTLLGYGEHELLGLHVRDVMHPSDLEACFAAYRRLIETGRDTSELVLRRKDGSPVRVRLDSVRLEDGTSMGFCKDVTDRWNAEKQLENSVRLYGTLLETIPAPVFYKDSDGRYLGANRHFLDFYGIPPDRLIGSTVFDVFSPEPARIFKEKDDELLQAPGSQIYETRVTDASGRKRDVVFHKATFDDAHGGVGGIVGIILDITDRKQAEERRELYFQAIQSIDQPVVITDPDGNITGVNRAFSTMYGFTPDDVLGKNPRVLNPGKEVYRNLGYSDEEYERLFTHLWKSLKDPRHGTWENTVINRKKDGSLVWVRLLINSVYDDSGRLRNIIALPIDISDWRNRETHSRIELYRTISSLAALRDSETGNHMRRVGIFARILAKELGMSAKFCDDIELFAPMHDIGKVGIPDSLLLSTGKLTGEEFEVIKSHTVLGHTIVKGNRDLEMVAEITRSHHERFDGRGYPDGLSGERIPVSARITSVADVYDALRTRRPYKQAWTHEQASGEILRNAGTQFDPALIARFAALLPRFEAVYRELSD